MFMRPLPMGNACTESAPASSTARIWPMARLPFPRPQPGSKADVILIDTGNAIFTPLITDSAAHVQSHLAFLANGIVVDTSIIDGWSRSRPRSTPR